MKPPMKFNNSFPNSFRWLLLITGLLIFTLLFFLIFVENEIRKTILFDITSPAICILITCTLFITTRYTARTRPWQAKSWQLWAIAFTFYTLGDICWAVLELVLKVAPFPSLADFFYFLSYGFVLLGLVRYPADHLSKNERGLVWLDNLIVILGASLVYWFFLINPLILESGEVDFVSALLVVTYPVMDLMLLWTILTFFRNRLQQSTYVPLILIGLCLFSQVVGDSLFAYRSLGANLISSSSTQVGWTLGLLFLVAANFAQVKSIFEEKEPGIPVEKVKSFNSWPLYLPYIWVGISYGILVTLVSPENQSLLLYIAVGLIGGLVIFRQVLTLNENERLFNNAEAELKERQLAQEALRQMNFELDARVQKRTNDLFLANEKLVQTNLSIEESLREKEVLLKEIHHRVKNNLQIISSLLNLQAGKVKDPQTTQALRESQMRVRSMALIHEKLYQSESLAKIDFGGYVKSLASDLFRSYQRGLGKVQLKIVVDEVELGLDQAVPCGLILNELMTNALKHAFPDGRSGTLSVNLCVGSGQILSLSVVDDGVGLPPEFDLAAAKSLGLQLVNSLMVQLDGRLEVDHTGGAAFKVSFGYRSLEVGR